MHLAQEEAPAIPILTPSVKACGPQLSKNVRVPCQARLLSRRLCPARNQGIVYTRAYSTYTDLERGSGVVIPTYLFSLARLLIMAVQHSTAQDRFMTSNNCWKIRFDGFRSPGSDNSYQISGTGHKLSCNIESLPNFSPFSTSLPL